MILRHIRYFLAVACEGSFTRAAEALHVSQPTLSQQIRQLEDILGTVLFDRSGRRVQLTDSGRIWMQYARQVLQGLDDGARALHDVETLERGTLRLAMTPTFTAYVAGPIVDAFYQRYPGITLNISEITEDKIIAMLSDDKLDMGIAFNALKSTDIEVTNLFEESLKVVVGRTHPLAQRDGITLDDFAHQSLALLNEDFATRQFIDLYLHQHGIRPQVTVEANAIGMIIEIVRHGRLVTVLPEAIASEHPQLCALSLDVALHSRRAVLLQRKGAYQSAASRAFTALLREVMCARFDCNATR